MKRYRISIPMPPQGKGRARAYRVGGHARLVTPERTRNYEAQVKSLARQAVGDLLLEGPIGVKIWAVFGRSKEQSKVLKKTNRPKHLPCFLWAHKKRVDADNISKTILDALNKVIWIDDRQVVDLEVHKVIANMVETPEGWKATAPRVEIQICEYEQPPIAAFEPPRWCGGPNVG